MVSALNACTEERMIINSTETKSFFDIKWFNICVVKMRERTISWSYMPVLALAYDAFSNFRSIGITCIN